MGSYVEYFIRDCIEQGWEYDEILVALEDEYGMSNYAANTAIPTVQLEMNIYEGKIKYIDKSNLPSADNYADWERMILNGIQ